MAKENEVKSQQRPPRDVGADVSRGAAEIHTLIQLIYGELAVTRPWLASALAMGGSRQVVHGGSVPPSSPWTSSVPWGW